MTLLSKLTSIPPREKAGATTSARYDFQAHFSILKILDLHAEGSDYRAVFDHFDDLLILDSASEGAKHATFYQVKGKANGAWTMKALTKLKPGDPPRSVVGKMYDNVNTFPAEVIATTFITNAAFNFTLANGKKTTADNSVIKAADLATTEYVLIENAVAADYQPPTVDCRGLFIFERTPLGLTDQAAFVSGKLAQYFERLRNVTGVPVVSLYETLFAAAKDRIAFTSDLFTSEQLVTRKSLDHATVEELFKRAIDKTNDTFVTSWSTIEAELANNGFGWTDRIRLRNRCFQYFRDRNRGDAIASRFSVAAKSTSSAYASDIKAAATLFDVVSLLREKIPAGECGYQDQQLLAACIVESYEAL